MRTAEKGEDVAALLREVYGCQCKSMGLASFVVSRGIVVGVWSFSGLATPSSGALRVDLLNRPYGLESIRVPVPPTEGI